MNASRLFLENRRHPVRGQRLTTRRGCIGPITDSADSTTTKATAPMQKAKSGSNEGKAEDSPSQLIDARIKELGDWRGETLARIRALIKEAEPDVVEEWKWRGVPVWSRPGIICTGETYKNVVKMTFAQGRLVGGPVRLLQLQPRRQH